MFKRTFQALDRAIQALDLRVVGAACLAALLSAGCGHPAPAGLAAAPGFAPDAASRATKTPAQSLAGIQKQMKRYADNVFFELDDNRDGVITWSNGSGVPDLDLMGMKTSFRKLDLNDSGSVTREEFEHFFLSPTAYRKVQLETNRVFRLFDTNKDGEVGTPEFTNALTTLKGEKAPECLIPADFATGDVDNSRSLSFSEFEDVYFNAYMDIFGIPGIVS